MIKVMQLYNCHVAECAQGLPVMPYIYGSKESCQKPHAHIVARWDHFSHVSALV